MSQLAYKLPLTDSGETAPRLTVVASQQSKTTKISQEIIILTAVMAVLQILDGILTGIGISHWGTSAEGNMIIRHLMEQLGYVSALVLVKSFALGVLALLCLLSTQVSWIGKALKIVILVYLSAAIIPWSAIILSKLS